MINLEQYPKAMEPISWYKSQAMVGQVIAFIGLCAVAAPEFAHIFPEWADQILRWGGFTSLVIGLWNGASGRITTTRPIAGTKAAEVVEAKISEIRRNLP